MITGLRGSYQWIPVTDAVPAAFLPVILARLPDRRREGDVEPGYYDGSGWHSDTDGPVDDVTHWAHMPNTPVHEQMVKVLDALPDREGASDGA
ncbi:MAG: hypothetical protein IJT94_12920 [Oscillibacter sp.]|nr:hypothetical protein [Oscillibacter sp.]